MNAHHAGGWGTLEHCSEHLIMQTITHAHLPVYEVQCANAYTDVCMYLYTEHKFLVSYLSEHR
jgi:hypothetical protein